MVDRLMGAEAEITRLHQERERWIDYTTDLQRIIEALCDRRGLPEPVSTARHHYNMAREHLAAERLAGARMKAEEIVRKAIENCRELNEQAGRPAWEVAIETAILAALAEPAGEAEPDETPIAAEDGREVDWVDVTGWGVYKGHAIPVDVARYIATKINLYAEHRTTPPDPSAIREAAEIARACLAGLVSAGHNFPSPKPEQIETAFWALDKALAGAKP